ncbi:MAG: DNA polymerase III subunit delta' [Candidatus Pacebacteria bacterium]|nr:DNA polymerase III subunit delta' [Candidatus Paceibacterota bacterium]
MQSPRLPHQNTELLGHEAAESLIVDAVNRGRLHHAWLISGKAGIGKATLAWRMARYILARDSPASVRSEEEAGFGFIEAPTMVVKTDLAASHQSLAIAPDHPVAQQIAARVHRNIRAIERLEDSKTGKTKASIGVDQLRELQGFFQTTVRDSSHRFVIIDTVDDMTLQAQNALLKMLEEPPSGAILLLVSHIPGRLLPTIRSRCRHLPLRSLDQGVMERLLTAAGVEPASMATALRLGEGSIGRALTLMSGGAESFYQQLLQQLTEPSFDGRRAIADQLAGAGGASELALWGEVLDWLVMRLSRQMVRPPSGAPVAAEQAACQSLEQRLGLERLLEGWDANRKLLGEALELNLDRRQVVMEVLTRM